MHTFFKMLSNFGLSVIALMVAVVSFGGTASAADQGLLFGQQHRYSVIMRGNGEAIVYARLVVYNQTDNEMGIVNFEIPGQKAYELLAFQQILPRPCIQYRVMQNVLPGSPRVCDQYQEPDYSQEYYSGYYPDGSQAVYKKIIPFQSGQVYTLTLSEPIQPGKSGSVIVSYAAQGYVAKKFGTFRFAFPTLKVDSRVQNARVVVDVDSDLVLKGKKSKVDYNTASISEGFASADKAAGVQSQAMDAVVRQIGTYGSLVKEAKSLAPGESLIVRGEYAESALPLYYGAILKTVLVVLLIFVLLYVLYRYRKLHPRKVEVKTGVSSVAVSHEGTISILNPYYASFGFFSAVGVILLSLLVSKVDNFFNYLNSPNPIFIIIGFVVVVLMYVLVVFGPAAFAATKYGWKAFISVIISQLLWVFLFLVLYGFWYHSGLRQGSSSPQPMYYKTQVDDAR